MSGKTFTAHEIVTALVQRGFAVVTAEYFDKSQDNIDTVYVETAMNSVMRIAISEVTKNG